MVWQTLHLWAVRGLSVLCFTVGVFAQAPVAPRFEVSSIKPTPREQTPKFDYCQQSGRFTMLGTPVIWSMKYAYQVKDYQIAGAPDWLLAWDTAYNIEATTGGPVSVEQCRLMVQSLFAERFKLKTHRETRESPVYLLKIGKRSKLREGGEVKLNGGVQIVDVGKPRWPDGLTMPQLAGILSDVTDRPVIDRTGLRKSYGITLDFSTAEGDGRPSIFTAVQEQLGLKLQAGRAPVEKLIIDHIEKPTANE